MYTGLRGGAVPVYKGAPEVLQHVPGPRSIILADDHSGASALGRYLKRLLVEPAEYARYFEWDLAEFSRRETVAQCPWQCKACEWVADRRAGRRALGGASRERSVSGTP